MQRLCHEQTEAFGVLLRRYERELFGYLNRYLRNSSQAEDVFQNTFLQVFLKRKQFEAGRPVRPWLYTIATNQAIDFLRRQSRHQAVSLEQAADAGQAASQGLLETLESHGPGPLELASEEERRQRVRASVDQLPEFLRQVLILAYYQGLKYRDIADIMNIPVGTVKSRLHAALVRLQAAWAELPSLFEA